MANFNNKYGIARINQEGERLFTVRPRYYATNPDDPKRGEAATLRLVLSDKTMSVDEIAQGMPYHEKIAFKKLMNPDDEMGGYKDFLVTNIAYEVMEKYQVFQTFGGGEAVYFYGRAPLALRISGLTMDDLDNDQFVRMTSLYMNHLRGTQAARNYALVELSMPNATFFGSITSMAFNQDSNRDTDISFTMGFLVKEVIFRSTDVYFQNDSGEVQDYQDANILGTRDLPTISQGDINKMRSDQIAQLRSQSRSEDQLATLRANGQPVSKSDANAILNGGHTYVDKDGRLHNSQLGVFGVYTSAIGSIPSMSDLLGIGPEEIASLLNDWNNILNDVLSVPNSIINKVNDYTDEAVSYLKEVERGVGSLMDTVTGVVGAAQGALDKTMDTVGTIMNFPQSLAGKVGNFLQGGFMNPFGASGASIGTGGGGGGSSDSNALIGGVALDADAAGALLSAGAREDPGPQRGAVLSPPPIKTGIHKDSDDSAVLPGGF